MSEHFKNILSGIGSVFVSPSPMRGYTRVRRDGFARDARNLAADRRAVGSDLGRSIRSASRGKKQ